MAGAKRGRKPGTPKTGGRQKGTPNKLTAKLKAKISDLAQDYGPMAMQVLVDIAEHGESETARITAATAILDRAYGKPAQTVAGDPEKPVVHEVRWVVVPAHPGS
jgi:hypothetical protein